MRVSAYHSSANAHVHDTAGDVFSSLSDLNLAVLIVTTCTQITGNNKQCQYIYNLPRTAATFTITNDVDVSDLH